MLGGKKGAAFDERNTLSSVDLLCFGVVWQPVAQETLNF